MKRFRSNKEIKVYVVSSFVEILGYITLHKDCIARYLDITFISSFYYGRTLSERPCYILPMFFYIFFIPALVGQTAERIFTKLSHVVDIRHHL